MTRVSETYCLFCSGEHPRSQNCVSYFKGEVLNEDRAESNQIRKFSTGATRDLDENKPDYEGFLSPLVIERYGTYMSSHRKQVDGSLRDSDNWQKGIPLPVYIKSMFRHFFDVWKLHRGYEAKDFTTGKSYEIDEALCALMFNVSGYLHEYLKAKNAS